MIKKLMILGLAALSIYGLNRLYFSVTGGFSYANIASSNQYDPKWDTHPLSEAERNEIEHAFDQEYSYLGRGCQAYVFASQDGNYVLKFFKYQHFRPQPWIHLFTFIPAVSAYREDKIEEKKARLDKIFTSWKIAYDVLQDETGVIYLHLNKGDEWKKRLVIRDKMGLPMQLEVDKMEFMLQRRAEMLCAAVDHLMERGELDKGKLLIDRLLTMLLLEYGRGYADNDHALMQNTGVIDGKPIHIDIGQFIYNDSVKAPKGYKQELYDKMFKFHQWLDGRYPPLAYHLKARIVAIIGPDYYYSAPYVHKGDVAKIPHQEPT